MRAKELLQGKQAPRQQEERNACRTKKLYYKLPDTISLGNYTKKTTSGPTQPS